MIYAFVLGRVYSLSIAELLAVLKDANASLGLPGGPLKILEASREILMIETPQALNAENLQKRLGGVIKILKVVDAVPKREQDSLNFALRHYFKPGKLKKDFFRDYKGKKQFGISVYLLDETINAFGEPKRLGMMIKKTLVESGLSVRLVLPEFNSLALASVVVTKNLLLEKGAEICVLVGPKKVYTARTLVVQDFEDYGRRDYQRPVRDEKQGMIPPKVAQIMLNLSGCEPPATILDPFCGIGTIVQEGVLLGYKMLGSDINKQAIKGSEQNLEWFKNRYKIPNGKYHLEVSDAAQIAKLLEGQQICAIVTECTLGPLYTQFPKEEEIQKNFEQLRQLYIKSFKEFKKILPPKGRVVICLPAYKKGKNNYVQCPTLDWADRLGYNLVDIIPGKIAKNLKFLNLTARKTAIYDRKDQIVAREIAIFENQ